MQPCMEGLGRFGTLMQACLQRQLSIVSTCLYGGLWKQPGILHGILSCSPWAFRPIHSLHRTSSHSLTVSQQAQIQVRFHENKSVQAATTSLSTLVLTQVSRNQSYRHNMEKSEKTRGQAHEPSSADIAI